MNDNDVSGIEKTLFLGLKAYPYYAELDEVLEEQFGLIEFLLNEDEHPSYEKEAEGLSDAYIRNTLSVSFCSHYVWKKCAISLKMRDEDGMEEINEVVHSCGCATCLDSNFESWLKKRNRPPLNSHADVDIWFPTSDYDLSNRAKDDLIFFYQNNLHTLIEIIENFIEEIWVNPRSGTGKPETLTGNLEGWMSRRISQKHRLVYKLDQDVLSIYSCQGHYNDK
jgi:toxin YoeB